MIKSIDTISQVFGTDDWRGVISIGQWHLGVFVPSKAECETLLRNVTHYSLLVEQGSTRIALISTRVIWDLQNVVCDVHRWHDVAKFLFSDARWHFVNWKEDRIVDITGYMRFVSDLLSFESNLVAEHPEAAKEARRIIKRGAVRTIGHIEHCIE